MQSICFHQFPCSGNIAFFTIVKTSAFTIESSAAVAPSGRFALGIIDMYSIISKRLSGLAEASGGFLLRLGDAFPKLLRLGDDDLGDNDGVNFCVRATPTK